MKVKTITCHDVYNFGASLQAYALATYLQQCGHEVEIIDYKPDYLSKHYSLTTINNPKYNIPIVRELYLIAKFPGRLKALCGIRKKRFDKFREDYLPLTRTRYCSFDDLANNCPNADIYIAGSDQIWNPIFPNGKDPSFFLQFVPNGKRCLSYAASFSIDKLPAEDSNRMEIWLKKFDAISVREISGLNHLAEMGLNGQHVCDPVFLLNQSDWAKLAAPLSEDPYILVYDFDHNPLCADTALKLKREKNLKILSIFPSDYADKVCNHFGPLEFLGAIKNAEVVLSNSFHATAFALIFHREFFVVNRSDGINSRMRDLLCSLDLQDRLISDVQKSENPPHISVAVEQTLQNQIAISKLYLSQHLEL